MLRALCSQFGFVWPMTVFGFVLEALNLGALVFVILQFLPSLTPCRTTERHQKKKSFVFFFLIPTTIERIFLHQDGFPCSQRTTVLILYSLSITFAKLFLLFSMTYYSSHFSINW